MSSFLFLFYFILFKLSCVKLKIMLCRLVMTMSHIGTNIMWKILILSLYLLFCLI